MAMTTTDASCAANWPMWAPASSRQQSQRHRAPCCWRLFTKCGRKPAGEVERRIGRRDDATVDGDGAEHPAASDGTKTRGQGGKSVFEIIWPIYMHVKSFRTEAKRLEEEMARQAIDLHELEDLIEKIWGWCRHMLTLRRFVERHPCIYTSCLRSVFRAFLGAHCLSEAYRKLELPPGPSASQYMYTESVIRAVQMNKRQTPIYTHPHI